MGGSSSHDGPAAQEQFLQRYTMGMEVSPGAIPRVFTARSKTDKKLYLVTVFNPRNPAPQGTVAPAKDHQAILRRLGTHPHVERLLDSYVDAGDGSCFLVTERFERTLKECLRDPPSADPTVVADVARVMFEALSGLRHVHDSGIVHRQVEPGRIVLTGADGRTAKLVGFLSAVPLFKKGVLLTGHVGSEEYMSPEMYADAEYCEKTDIWSFGVMFYAVVYGELPLAALPCGPHGGAAVAAHLLCERRGPSLCEPPKEAGVFVRALLQHNEKARPSAADALGLAFLRQPAAEAASALAAGEDTRLGSNGAASDGRGQGTRRSVRRGSPARTSIRGGGVMPAQSPLPSSGHGGGRRGSRGKRHNSPEPGPMPGSGHSAAWKRQASNGSTGVPSTRVSSTSARTSIRAQDVEEDPRQNESQTTDGLRKHPSPPPRLAGIAALVREGRRASNDARKGSKEFARRGSKEVRQGSKVKPGPLRGSGHTDVPSGIGLGTSHRHRLGSVATERPSVTYVAEDPQLPPPPPMVHHMDFQDDIPRSPSSPQLPLEESGSPPRRERRLSVSRSTSSPRLPREENGPPPRRELAHCPSRSASPGALIDKVPSNLSLDMQIAQHATSVSNWGRQISAQSAQSQASASSRASSRFGFRLRSRTTSKSKVVGPLRGAGHDRRRSPKSHVPEILVD